MAELGRFSCQLNETPAYSRINARRKTLEERNETA
jgi:hypothetical protein